MDVNVDTVYVLFTRLQNAELKERFLGFVQKNMLPWLSKLDRSSDRDSLMLRMQTIESLLKDKK